MDGRCPFCLDRSIIRVGPLVRGPAAGGSRILMECGACEKWFWADSGEEVPRLFDICATSMISPGRCYEEVREILNSGGNGFPRRRISEFNRLCSDCLNARFMAEKIEAHA
jgi:hypothetical protein